MSWFPPPSRPRPVEGGLKARSTRGAIARTWWSERFIEVLEDIGIGNRLQRGRTYARKGQVISLDVDPGSVTAQVQGSRPRPYRVRIGIPAFGKAEWAQAERCPGRQRLVHGQAARPARCPRTSRTSSPDWACRCSRTPPASCRWTAPARTGRCRASTWPPRSTCSPSPSTTTRSPSSPGAAANARTCSTTSRRMRTAGPPAADRAELTGRATGRLPGHLLHPAGRDPPTRPAGHRAHGLARPTAGHRRHRARPPAGRPAEPGLPDIRAR